jgi:hypothetical protein
LELFTAVFDPLEFLIEEDIESGDLKVGEFIALSSGPNL